MHFLSSHKKVLFILLPFLALFLIFSGIYMLHIISPTENECYRTRQLEEMEHASSFSEFVNALFCYEVTNDSITTAYTLKNPASYQIPSLSPTLSSFSYKEYEKNKQKGTDTKILSLLSGMLKKFNISDLNEQEQITYSLLEQHFDLNKELCKYAYYEELLGSTTGVQANLPVTLGEYPLHTEENVNTYLTLLTQIPAYFENVISYEKHRTDMGCRTPDFLLHSSKKELSTLLESFQKPDNCFIDTFDERISQIEGISAKKKEHYRKQNRDYVKKYVIPAYQTLYNYMDRILQNGNTSQDCIPDSNASYGLSTLPDGDTYYELLVKSNTGSSHSVPELISMTEQTLHQALGDVLNIALTHQDAYFYYCENPIVSYYKTPETILEALSLMIREDYPVLKDTPAYTVKSVPESLATSVSPAFYMIPAIDDYKNNTIYINSLYTNEENGNLFTTLAHEGFPGHLYQTVYFNDTNPDIIRQIIDYPGYVEGWATYVELNAFTFLDYSLEGDSLCQLYQADTIINLALCSRIDMGVNYENWTLNDVNKFFEDAGFNSYYAADVYSYVVEAPSVYLRYFIGYLEIKELKEAYQHEKMEEYSEKTFHKAFLDIGPSDFDTLRKYMLTNP